MNKTLPTLMLLSASQLHAGQWYGEFGVGHMIRITDPNIYDTYWSGDHTPCWLGLGHSWRPSTRFQIDADWHHQSYCLRGWPVNKKPEAQIDAVRINFRWYF